MKNRADDWGSRIEWDESRFGRTVRISVLVFGAMIGISLAQLAVAEASQGDLLVAQAGSEQPPSPSQFSGPPGLIPRTPQVGVPVPIPVPVPVPGYYGTPTPYGYGGYPYGGYGSPYGSQPFGSQPYTGPKAGHIQLVVDPVDAQVFIDGHEVKQQSDFTFVVNLLEGQHRLQIARDGFKPYDQPLDVPGGGGYVLAVRLEK